MMNAVLVTGETLTGVAQMAGPISIGDLAQTVDPTLMVGVISIGVTWTAATALANRVRMVGRTSTAQGVTDVPASMVAPTSIGQGLTAAVISTAGPTSAIAAVISRV